MKHLLLASLVIFSACSKQGPESPKGDSNAPGSSDSPARVVLMKAPLKAEIGEGGLVLDESEISLETTRRHYVSRVIVVRNSTTTDKALAVDLSALNPAIESDTSCKTSLGARRSCVINVYYNRQMDQETGALIEASNISISSGGFSSSVSVSAAVTGETAEEEAQAEIEINKLAVSFPSKHFVGKEESDLIIIRNRDSKSHVVDLDISSLSNGWSVQNHCPAQLPARRACAIEVIHSSSTSGSASSSFTLLGQQIALSAEVLEMPTYETNPNLESSPIPSAITIQDGSASQSYTVQFYNPGNPSDDMAGALLYPKDINYGDISLLPEAFKSVNTCSTELLRSRTCHTTFSFDPERFHFGITMAHNIFLAGEEVSLTLSGNSPCNPDHESPRSDAQYGWKLNAAKTACVPNVGVYDGADSYYGHAVFE